MTAEKLNLKCRQCSKKFKYDSERRRHEQSHFPQFQCKICSKNFSFISALRRHEKQHERTGSVQCSKCSREFRDNTLLKRHIKYAHGGTYTCTKCSAIFSSEPALGTHMKTHKSESERRYQCSFDGCTKKFNFAHHLKHHELTHTNTKQHFCKICNKGFIQSHHLKTHLKTHTADTSLHCSFPGCSRKFATAYAKKRHVTKHHVKTDSGISSDSNSTCDLSFVPKYETDNDAITCSSCGKTMPKTQYEEHTFICISEEREKYVTGTKPQAVTLINTGLDSFTDTSNNNVDDEVSNCKSVLGSCIMSVKGEKCVCAQISKTIGEDYDFTPIDNEPVNMTKLNDAGDLCGGCECSERCNIGNNNFGLIEDETSVVEYKTDGTVKLKDIFDLDIPLVKPPKLENNSLKKTMNDAKFFPYNSCKAVLGNCIVSGNGTMSDGCLCARMFLDDQVTAQEIEDITPRPKN